VTRVLHGFGLREKAQQLGWSEAAIRRLRRTDCRDGVTTIGGGLRPGLFREDLRRMVQFAELFPEQEIVATLSRQLSWSHFSTSARSCPSVSPSSGNSTRRWPGSKPGACVPFVRASTRLDERTALSKQPDEMIRQELAILRSKGDLTPALLLKDPYVLDFLGAYRPLFGA
jgi:hypothetical protein